MRTLGINVVFQLTRNRLSLPGRGLPIEGSVQILKTDPELGLRVPATEIADARTQLVARVKTIDPGRWEVPHDSSSRLGFLMLDGLLARDVVLVGTTCTELIGEGDVIQPWVPSTEDGLVRYHVLWHVLSPSKLAVLDDAFARTLADWPQVMSMLLERAIRRTLRMSVHQALLQLSPVETRLLVLFWHLAERWGRVTPNGISVRLRMSHELLGQLVGCRRSSVTTALHRVNDSGMVIRKEDGTWLLRGSPPDELAEIHWDQRSASVAG